MPETLILSYLERNLACLGPANRDFAAAVRHASPAAIEWETASDGTLTGSLDGRRLASRHRPHEEGVRLAESVDVLEHAVFVVLGFGVGHHAEQLAKRVDRSGVLVIFEPDLSLVRAVFERVDLTGWLNQAIVIWIHDANDRAAIARKLSGAESIVAQGVAILEHPAHRARLGEQASRFTSVFREFVSASKTTLLTTLVRSHNTIENLLGNLDHYVQVPGLTDLKNVAEDRLAVIVSAGPSLQKNIGLLAEPGVRDRCVIIAVQTSLKPLLEAGIRPHFVTALDYHEISKRFYEGLTPGMVEGVTLVAEPKAHPIILDSFPGAIRCVGNGFLDKALGPLARDMGNIASGATVAHLAFYLARYMGCNPIAFIGQDLGFTDGLYYARGTAIHDIWAPELNPFNTIEMMEWQRIARHRVHLHKSVDHEGKSIYTDAQMLTYLQQFERDFAEAEEQGALIIDATEGGVRKQHTQTRTLADTLAQFAKHQMPELPSPPVSLDRRRLTEARERVKSVRHDVASLQSVSRKTTSLLRQMMQDQRDSRKMDRHFERMEQHRAKVAELFDAFELLNLLNQLGVFRRQRSDRRLQLSANFSSLEKQRAQLERDLDNVTWIVDAADELIGLLVRAEELLNGGRFDRLAGSDSPQRIESDHAQTRPATASSKRVAAIIAVDPARHLSDEQRHLQRTFLGSTILQATLENLNRSVRLDSVILLVPDSFDPSLLLDESRLQHRLIVERCGNSPFGPEHRAVMLARRWAETSWRGGIAGIAACDEALAPQAMRPVMEKHALDAAIIVGPDWPLVDPSDESGIDALIARFQEQPDQHGLVFTQSPPGLGACLVSRTLMTEFSQRNRLSTIGGVLIYQPHAPQHDPIAREANVAVPQRLRRSLIRAAAETSSRCKRLERALRAQGINDPQSASSCQIADAIESLDEPLTRPQHIMLELTTRRVDHGRFADSLRCRTGRPDFDMDGVLKLFDQLDGREQVISLVGAGDPLLHPQFDEIINGARTRGLPIHVRTTLLPGRAAIERLMNARPDVISIDLHADRGETHAAMMGEDRLGEVIEHIEWIISQREHLTPQPGTAAMALPWIVPRLQRRRETYEDIDSFYDRWMAVLGCAVIEGPPPFDDRDDDLATAMAPERVMWHELNRRMLILSDGAVPLRELDLNGSTSVGTVLDLPLADIWTRLLHNRKALRAAEGEQCEGLRTLWP